MSDIQERIICAACKQGDLILAGVRHFDLVMASQMEAINKDEISYFARAEQGFVNQRGEFRTREEAFIIAKAAGQLEGRIKADYPSSTTLYSEDLY